MSHTEVDNIIRDKLVEIQNLLQRFDKIIQEIGTPQETNKSRTLCYGLSENIRSKLNELNQFMTQHNNEISEEVRNESIQLSRKIRTNLDRAKNVIQKPHKYSTESIKTKTDEKSSLLSNQHVNISKSYDANSTNKMDNKSVQKKYSSEHEEEEEEEQEQLQQQPQPQSQQPQSQPQQPPQQKLQKQKIDDDSDDEDEDDGGEEEVLESSGSSDVNDELEMELESAPKKNKKHQHQYQHQPLKSKSKTKPLQTQTQTQTQTTTKKPNDGMDIELDTSYMQSVTVHQDDFALEREDAMHNINYELRSMHEVIQDLQDVVTTQGELVDRLEHDVVQSHEQTDKGNEQLMIFELRAKRKRTQRLWLLVFLLGVIAMLILMIVEVTNNNDK